MPEAFIEPMSKWQLFDVKKNPYICLALTLRQLKESNMGLRKEQELVEYLQGFHDRVRQEDPYQYYVNKQSWTTNNNHKVFLVEHLETQMKYVMKVSPIGSLKRETEKPGENTVLLALSDSENIINVKDIYVWEGRIYTIIDYMEGKELTHVI